MCTKTVVVLPGSDWQIPIVKRIKEMGHRVLVINPYENSPAFAYADGFLQSDIFSENDVLDFCKKEKADAIISEECDIAMPALARYGETLGLCTLSSDMARLYTDKFAMREFCKEHDIPSPEYRICYTIEEATDFYFHMGGQKMIMKPLDSNSSRGVFTVKSAEDILMHFEETVSFSKVKRNAALLERYVSGTEFTVDGVMTPGGHHSLAVSEKKHYRHNENIACELYFTYMNQKYDYDLLRKTNDRLINASDLKFGLTHAEYKYENGQFFLIEIAARGGGNRISSDIVPFMSGIDNYRYLIDCSLGMIPDIDFSETEKYQNRAAVLKFFSSPKSSGICKETVGEEVLEDDSRIVAHQFNIKAGDMVADAVNDAARIGYYIACCESEEELQDLMGNIERRVYIVCE